MNIRPESLIDTPLMAHARATLRNSQRWFPTPDGLTGRWQIEHQALGLVGECGEVVEHVKKWHRRDFDTDELRARLVSELPDVLTYLLNLAALLDVDLDEALAAKQAECERRWGQP